MFLGFYGQQYFFFFFCNFSVFLPFDLCDVIVMLHGNCWCLFWSIWIKGTKIYRYQIHHQKALIIENVCMVANNNINKCRRFIVHYASLTCNSTRPQHTLQSIYNQQHPLVRHVTKNVGYTQQISYSISHLLDTGTTQWLPPWRCSHCALVPDTDYWTVTTSDTHVIRYPLSWGLCRNLSTT